MTFLSLYPQTLAQDLVLNKYLLNNLICIKFKTFNRNSLRSFPPKKKNKTKSQQFLEQLFNIVLNVKSHRIKPNTAPTLKSYYSFNPMNIHWVLLCANVYE